jgi:hypothetical protein
MTNGTEYITTQKYNHISQQFTKYAGPLLYIICLFGTIMNVLTFLQQIFKRRACSLYLLIASVCDFIHLNLGPLSNILQYGFHYDWTIKSLIYCKTKNYFDYVFLISSGTLTILASLDRYMLSCENSARWNYSCRHIGIRYIKVTIFFWVFMSIPILFCTKRSSHVSQNEQLICSNPSGYLPCYLVLIIYNCLFNGFFPPFIMMVFAFLTRYNIRHLYRRTRPKSVQGHRINQQLSSMLISQSIKSTCASIPFSIFNCYWLMTLTTSKSLLFQAKENLIHQIVYLLFWSNYTSFFVYMYSSQTFRNQWIIAIKRITCCLNTRRERRYCLTRN